MPVCAALRRSGYYFTKGSVITNPISNFQSPGTKAAIFVGWVLSAGLAWFTLVWRACGGDSTIVQMAPLQAEDYAYDDEACLASGSRSIVESTARLVASVVEGVAHLLCLSETVCPGRGGGGGAAASR